MRLSGFKHEDILMFRDFYMKHLGKFDVVPDTELVPGSSLTLTTEIHTDKIIKRVTNIIILRFKAK